MIRSFQKGGGKTYQKYRFPVGQHKNGIGYRGEGGGRFSLLQQLAYAQTVTGTVTKHAKAQTDTSGTLENSGAGEGNRTLVISLGS